MSFLVLLLGEETDKNTMRKHSEQQRDTQRTTDFMELNRVFTVEEFASHLGGQKSLAEYRVRFVPDGWVWLRKNLPIGKTFDSEREFCRVFTDRENSGDRQGD